MDQLTSFQISEWEAYDRIDPIGTWREDLRTAKLMSMMNNLAILINTEKGNSPDLTSPIDFMPDWTGDKEKEVKQQDPEEIKNLFFALANEQNAKVKKEKSLKRTTPPKQRV